MTGKKEFMERLLAQCLFFENAVKTNWQVWYDIMCTYHESTLMFTLKQM